MLGKGILELEEVHSLKVLGFASDAKGVMDQVPAGVCGDLVGRPFHNSEFNWCWGIDQNQNSFLSLLMWWSEHVSNENPFLLSNCSVCSGPGLHGKPDDYIWMNTQVKWEMKKKISVFQYVCYQLILPCIRPSKYSRIVVIFVQYKCSSRPII